MSGNNLTHWQQLALNAYRDSAQQLGLTPAAHQYGSSADGHPHLYAARPFHHHGHKALLWLGAVQEQHSALIGPEHRMVLVMLFQPSPASKAQAIANSFHKACSHYQNPYFFGLRAYANRLGDIPLKLGAELEPPFRHAANSIISGGNYVAAALIGNQLPNHAELTCHAICNYAQHVSPVIKRFGLQVKNQLPSAQAAEVVD